MIEFNCRRDLRSIGSDYDQIFTESLIGRAQRNAVWKILNRTFSEKDNILELNCGTGEDAIHLASRGYRYLHAMPRER